MLERVRGSIGRLCMHGGCRWWLLACFVEIEEKVVRMRWLALVLLLEQEMGIQEGKG